MEVKRTLVTGASGNIGREVVKELLERNQRFVAGALDQKDAERIPGESTAVVHLNFTDPRTYAEAFQDVDRLFLMRPPHISNTKRDMNPLLDFAVSAGVEQYILALDVPYTFLRPSFFMQNLNTVHQEEIRVRDEIIVPVGKARTSFIDVRDIGAAAAVVLSESGHENKSYDLTGGEALDYYQVASLFTEILRRKITFRDPSTFSFILHSMRSGRAVDFTLVLAMLYRATRTGMADQISDNVSKLSGRLPIAMAQSIRDYKNAWM